MNTTTMYDIFDLAKDLNKATTKEEGIEALIKFEKAKDEAYTKTLATKIDLEILQKNLLLKISWTMGGMFLAAIIILDFLLKR